MDSMAFTATMAQWNGNDEARPPAGRPEEAWRGAHHLQIAPASPAAGSLRRPKLLPASSGDNLPRPARGFRLPTLRILSPGKQTQS